MARLARGLWPDHNPLRRAADRAEAALVGLIAVAFLAGSPAAAFAAWHWAYAAGKHVERLERADRHKVPAVLLQRVPVPSYTPYGAVTPPVRARWTAPDGTRMTGLVNAVAGGAGTKITLWTDESGHPVSAPLPQGQVVHQAALGAAAGPVVLGVVLFIAWALARGALNRRRLAAWDADWRATGPIWTSRR